MSFEETGWEELPSAVDVLGEVVEIESRREAAIAAAKRLADFDLTAWAEEKASDAGISEREERAFVSAVYGFFHLLPDIRAHIHDLSEGKAAKDNPIKPNGHIEKIEEFAGALSLAAGALEEELVGSFNGVPIVAKPEFSQTDLMDQFYENMTVPPRQ
jgi:hypothetical protein